MKRFRHEQSFESPVKQIHNVPLWIYKDYRDELLAVLKGDCQEILQTIIKMYIINLINVEHDIQMDSNDLNYIDEIAESSQFSLASLLFGKVLSWQTLGWLYQQKYTLPEVMEDYQEIANMLSYLDRLNVQNIYQVEINQHALAKWIWHIQSYLLNNSLYTSFLFENIPPEDLWKELERYGMLQKFPNNELGVIITNYDLEHGQLDQVDLQNITTSRPN